MHPEPPAFAACIPRRQSLQTRPWSQNPKETTFPGSYSGMPSNLGIIRARLEGKLDNKREKGNCPTLYNWWRKTAPSKLNVRPWCLEQSFLWVWFMGMWGFMFFFLILRAWAIPNGIRLLGYSRVVIAASGLWRLLLRVRTPTLTYQTLLFCRFLL